MLMSCDCSVDDYDEPKVCTVRDVRARKQHWCCECGRAIEPGEQYELVKGLWDERWETHKTCLGCTRIRKHFCSSGWIYTALAEQVADCIGFNYTLDDDDDDDDECGGPCRYEERCELCEPYWLRMIADGLWETGKGWTDAGIKEGTK